MKIVLPGGSGQIGTILAKALSRANHDVVVLSRRPARAPWRVVEWDAKKSGEWQQEFEGADVVINLAGRSVNCRYSAANRRQILESRTESTNAVGCAILACKSPPRIWLQASTATIYAHSYDVPNDDVDGVLGGAEINVPKTWQFSIDVARSWEDAANQFELTATRRVLMRAAMVMSPDQGGVFDTLLRLARRGLGGTNGDGRQYVSWIHDHDFVQSVLWLIGHEQLEGPVNIASPNPLPNAMFMKQLRLAAGLNWGLKATKGMLEIGALLLRTETELLLKSRRVIPRKLTDSGFVFRFPSWQHASAELFERWHCLGMRA
jgi:uncharacterized protein